MVICYIISILVYFIKKNLATLVVIVNFKFPKQASLNFPQPRQRFPIQESESLHSFPEKNFFLFQSSAAFKLKRRQLFICSHHRNIRSRTSMLAQVLHIFLGKEHLVKNWLISTLDKVIYFKGTFFLRSTKPLFTSQNRVETS
jgi:hypothetical protein